MIVRRAIVETFRAETQDPRTLYSWTTLFQPHMQNLWYRGIQRYHTR